jgi:acetyl-CoA carboxylase carboxyltransferase component
VYQKLEAEYSNLQHPLRVANKFGIEEVIDPAKTRILICDWTQHMSVHSPGSRFRVSPLFEDRADLDILIQLRSIAA